MNVVNVNKVLYFLIVCIFTLLLVSNVSAMDQSSIDDFNGGTHYYVTPELSNEDIQSMMDNSNNGDTFEFTSDKYNDISLVVDKQLKIVSNKNSTIIVENTISDKAKQLGLTDSFGFYFTKNSAGSILSGFNIIADSCDYGIIIDNSSGTIIENNTISQANTNVLVKNADNVELNNNYIFKAKSDGIKVGDIANMKIINNTVAFNGRSGIEVSNMYSSFILINEIYHNSFNGISMYNKSSNNNISRNHVYENTNGIFLNAQSDSDLVLYNTLEYNRVDTNCELGAFESGNGLLFGDHFKSVGAVKTNISHNAMIHNENFQAKNNPLNEVFELGPTWVDANDPQYSYICPMLLAKLIKLDFSSVSNGIGFQLYEDGEPVKDFATFDQKVNIDGKEYTVTVKNGQAIVETDSTIEHEVSIDYKYRDKVIDQTKKTTKAYARSSSSSNPQKDNNPGDSSNSQTTNGGSGSDGETGDGNGHGSNGTGESLSDMVDNAVSAVSNALGQIAANFGINTSDVQSQSTSNNGDEKQSEGEQNAAEEGSSSSSSFVGDSDDANAYELYSNDISKSLQDNSALIALSIVLIIIVFIWGYRRKNEFE